MKRIAIALLAFVALVLPALEAQPPQRIPGLVGHFKRGLRPTPRHILASAPRFIPTRAAVSQIAYVPSKLSMWLNDTYGDCVTAEEAFAKACTVGNVPGVFISDDAVKAFASKNDLLNGADLDPVIKLMQQSGFSQDSNMYRDGAEAVVDYSNESALQAALAVGPVKIGIDADALPSGAGNNSGWVGVGGKPGQFNNEDHCVALAGFGTAQYLFSQLQVPLPSTLQPTQTGYLLYTWKTIGFVDHAWIMSTVGEAWVRNPTTTIVGTGTPTPDPSLNPVPAPTPVPTPPVPVPPAPLPVPTPPAPGTTTTITLNTSLPAGTFEVAPVGNASAVANAIAQLQAVSGGVSPTPPAPSGTLEQRVGVLETAVGKIISIVGDIQTGMSGMQQALGVKK